MKQQNAKIIDGSKRALEIRTKLSSLALKLIKPGVTKPCLAVIMVGKNPASDVYVNRKERAAKDLGIMTKVIRLASSTSYKKISETIKLLNEDETVHGIIVQLPLPLRLPMPSVGSLIAPDKDIDCLGGGSAYYRAPTAMAVQECLKIAKFKVKSSLIAVVGVGYFGLQIAKDLSWTGATIMMVNKETKSPKAITRQAQAVVTVLGRPELITADYIANGATVVDVGISRLGKNVVGDVKFQSVAKKAKYITPVPGGVGPLTVAFLLANVLEAYRRQRWLVG